KWSAAGRISSTKRDLQSKSTGGPGRSQCLPDGTRKRDQRRRADRPDSRFYVRRCDSCCSESLEGRRRRDCSIHVVFLPGDVYESEEAGRCVACGPVEDVKTQGLEVAILLGWVHHPGRMELVSPLRVNYNSPSWLILWQQPRALHKKWQI